MSAQKALAESDKLLAGRVKRAQAKVKFNEVQLELAKLNSENMNMVSYIGSLSDPRFNDFCHRKRSKPS